MQRILSGQQGRTLPGHGGATAFRRLPTERPLIDGRFDWTMVFLSAWFVAGVFLDGWAHNHIPELESFFTPWHAVFYSGYAAVSGFLLTALLRHRRQGFGWRQALPAGYELSLWGVGIFLIGGIGDMVWHELFGIEVDVEALVSPTHLILAVGGSLIMGGPFFAAWQRSDIRSPTLGWKDGLPVVLSLTFVLSVWTFMTQFAHPLVDPWAAIGFRAPASSRHVTYLRQASGVASILLQTGLSMGLILLAALRWRLPFGSLSLVFGLNALLMSFMHDQYRFIPGATVAGLGADFLLRWLRPSAVRLTALRLFACGVPIVFYGVYFATLLVTSGIEWRIHLAAGSVVLAGIVGWLLSYLIVPPSSHPGGKSHRRAGSPSD